MSIGLVGKPQGVRLHLDPTKNFKKGRSIGRQKLTTQELRMQQGVQHRPTTATTMVNKAVSGGLAVASALLGFAGRMFGRRKAA